MFALTTEEWRSRQGLPILGFLAEGSPVEPDHADGDVATVDCGAAMNGPHYLGAEGRWRCCAACTRAAETVVTLRRPAARIAGDRHGDAQRAG